MGDRSGPYLQCNNYFVMDVFSEEIIDIHIQDEDIRFEKANNFEKLHAEMKDLERRSRGKSPSGSATELPREAPADQCCISLNDSI